MQRKCRVNNKVKWYQFTPQEPPQHEPDSHDDEESEYEEAEAPDTEKAVTEIARLCWREPQDGHNTSSSTSRTL